MAFPYPYNISNMTALAGYVNTVTNDGFWTLVLYAFMVIVFFTMSGNEIRQSLTASTFSGAVIGVIMFIMNLISMGTLLVVLFLFAGSSAVNVWVHKT